MPQHHSWIQQKVCTLWSFIRIIHRTDHGESKTGCEFLEFLGFPSNNTSVLELNWSAKALELESKKNFVKANTQILHLSHTDGIGLCRTIAGSRHWYLWHQMHFSELSSKFNCSNHVRSPVQALKCAVLGYIRISMRIGIEVPIQGLRFGLVLTIRHWDD